MRRIAVTPRAALRPRGTHGQPVLDMHQQLSRLIGARTGDAEAAGFLAEPQVNRARDQIEWYSQGNGPVRAVAAMPAAERRAMLERAGELAERIRALAAVLRATGEPARVADADLLDAALVAPRADDLFLVGESLTAINWGCDPAAAAGVAPAEAPRHAAPPPRPAAPAAAAIGVTRIGPSAPPPPRRPLRWKRIAAWGLGTLAVLCLEPLLVAALVPAGEHGATAATARRQALQIATAEAAAAIDLRRFGCDRPADQFPVGLSLPEILRRLDAAGVDRTGVWFHLVWNGRDDLDLEVRTPSGEVVSHDHPRSRDGGRVEISMNHPGHASDTPLEVVAWRPPVSIRGELVPVVRRRSFHAGDAAPRPISGVIAGFHDREVLTYQHFVYPADRGPEWALPPVTIKRP